MTAHIDVDEAIGRVYLDSVRKLDQVEHDIATDPLAGADRAVLLAKALDALGAAFRDFTDVWRRPPVNEVALPAELIYGWPPIKTDGVLTVRETL